MPATRLGKFAGINRQDAKIAKKKPASLIGFVALGGLWRHWQQTKELRASLVEQQQARQEQIAGLQAENEQLRQASKASGQQDQAQQEIARLQAQIRELSAPQVNIPVLEIFPQGLAERGEREVNQLQIPRGAKAVTLILNSQSAAESKSYSLEILDARQNTVWSQQGQQNLTRHSTGDYTINIPTGLLPPGSYTFNVYGQVAGKRLKIESYRIRING